MGETRGWDRDAVPVKYQQQIDGGMVTRLILCQLPPLVIYLEFILPIGYSYSCPVIICFCLAKFLIIFITIIRIDGGLAIIPISVFYVANNIVVILLVVH